MKQIFSRRVWTVVTLSIGMGVAGVCTEIHAKHSDQSEGLTATGSQIHVFAHDLPNGISSAEVTAYERLVAPDGSSSSWGSVHVVQWHPATTGPESWQGYDVVTAAGTTIDADVDQKVRTGFASGRLSGFRSQWGEDWRVQRVDVSFEAALVATDKPFKETAINFQNRDLIAGGAEEWIAARSEIDARTANAAGFLSISYSDGLDTVDLLSAYPTDWGLLRRHNESQILTWSKGAPPPLQQ